jgi:hypothetical protein
MFWTQIKCGYIAEKATFLLYNVSKGDKNMAKYMIQSRGNSGKWQISRSFRTYAVLDAAVAQCCALDQDGIFSSDVRIVDDTGKVVCTGKAWLEQFHAAGQKDFRFDVTG